ASGALEPAVDVPAADDDCDLDAAVGHALDGHRDRGDPLRIGPERQVAHQRLAGQLEKDPLEDRRGTVLHVYSAPTWKREKRRMTTFSPVFCEMSARSCSIVRPSCFGFTCSWWSSTTSSRRFLILPSTILPRMFSGLSATSCSKTRFSLAMNSSGTCSSATHSGPIAAMCWATSRANSLKSSVRATKSV